MHFVGRLLEVAEEALQPIPVFRPLVGLAVIARRAVEHESLLRGRERGEGDIDRQAGLFGELDEVLLGLAVDLAFPRPDGAVRDGQGVVGDGEAVVDVDDTPKAAAPGAGAEGGVEGEQAGHGGPERAPRFR